MNIRNLLLALALVASVSTVPNVFASTPIGGLTVTLSPDGSTLLAGGDNRTLYVIDPATMDVKKRIWLGTTICKLSYNKDGSIVAIEDTDGVVHFLKSEDFSKVTSRKDLERMAVARDVDLGVGLDDDYQGNAVRFYSLTTGNELGKVLFPKGDRIACFGVNAAGDTVAVLQQSKKDSSEKKVSYSDIPKDLKGLARDEFEQKNDGESSVIGFYKIPSGEKIAEHKLFYKSNSSSSRIMFDGDDALVLAYDNENARVKQDGTIEMFELSGSYNYGIGVSPKQDLIMVGGLRDGALTTVDGMNATSFRVQDLPGWPEYFKGFCSDDNGTVYGSTSAYRVIKIKKSGQIEKEANCF